MTPALVIAILAVIISLVGFGYAVSAKRHRERLHEIQTWERFREVFKEDT